MADGLEWHSINDFRPGIHSSVEPNHEPGTAQTDGTFRCYPSSAGSLLPAPSFSQTVTRDPLVALDDLTSEQFRIVGVHANGPVYSVDNTTGTDECHDELFVCFEWWESDGMHLEVARYRRNLNSPEWESLWDRTDAAVTFNPATRPRNCDFATQRTNSSDSFRSGPLVVAWVVSGSARYFPTETTPASSSTAPIPGDIVDSPVEGGFVSPSRLVAHQGRAVIFPLYITGDGDDTVYITDEAAYWTSPNNLTAVDPTLTTGDFYFNVLGGYENGTGYGAVASLTANELLLVKQRGGGIMLRGSLGQSTVTNLPYMRSTGMSFNNGVATPKGFVYPVDHSGIWLWSGGETSTHITPHLAPDFWRPSTLIPSASPDTEPDQSLALWGHANTQCAWWSELVLFPANWFWDTDTDSWWRIEDPERFEIHRWTADSRGRRFWGAPAGYTNVDTPVLYEFTRQPANSYSWRSHPMPGTYDRQIEVRECVLVATGKGRVRLTWRSGTNQAGEQVDFIIDEERRPNITRQTVHLKGSHIELQIEAFGPEDGGPAPDVHEVRFGSRVGAHIER